MKIQFDAPPVAGQDASGLAVRYAAARRQPSRWRWYLLLALVMIPPLYLAFRFTAGVLWAQVPAMVVIEQAMLRAPMTGQVALKATAEQQVAAGAPLIRIQPATAMPLSEVSLEEEKRLRQALDLAQKQSSLARGRLEAMESLHRQGAATRPEVDTARSQWLRAEADTNSAHRDITAYRERLTQTTSRNGISPTQELSAPFAGQITQLLVRDGEWVAAGSDLALLQSKAPANIQAYLGPAEVKHAQVGASATLHFPDGGQIAATVIDIAPQVEKLPADRVSPLSPRTPALVVRLQPQTPLPDRYRIHALPLDVRFNWHW